ncbi:unnamed protein product [Adineta steineri]|uniref:BRCT domain-containing protein n=1 Tax=Adineta steineri TaxID=433720 RepID=A0A813ZL71_9BILA|nr:unnamed protein product [Adineta steineri]CAF1478934.1 unnamed protein product [Adineta steineri]
MIELSDDDDEPSFRVRFVKGKSIENNKNYWEEYDPLKKSWFRLCNECRSKVCTASDCLCKIHYNKENKPKDKIQLKSRNMKTKLKRLDTKIKKKNNNNNDDDKQIIPLEVINEPKIEQMQINESLPIVISVSTSLNRKQISQVKEFLTKFHNDSQSVQFTCESQPDYIDDTTTHVITNDYGSFTTTVSKQIIQACVYHIFISSFDWITASIKQSSIVDQFPYEILRDKKSIKTCRGIKQCRFDKLPVFPSLYIISVECHDGIKSMNMTRDELIEIIELSGATLLNDFIPYKTLIILCNSKKEMLDIKKQNDDNFLLINEKKIYYCKPAFVFDSIVKHEVQSMEKYCW